MPPVAEAGPAVRTRGRVRVRAETAAPAAVLALAAVWAAVRGIDHRYLSFSDGAYTYLASEVAQRGGGVLYGDVALSQPPVPVLGAAAVWHLSPSVEAIRLALAGLAALTALLAYRLGRACGLGPRTSAVAGALALVAPVHGAFSGLDGEALLAPLALVLALALVRRAPPWAVGAILGAGFLVKLTWAVFAAAALVALWRSGGPRAAARGLGAALAVAGAGWAALVAGFGWSPGDLVELLLRAESASGWQPALWPALAAVVAVLWWPVLALARAGRPGVPRDVLTLCAGGVAAGLFMLKQGTFFNVLDPVEPLLAVVAAAGAAALVRRGRRARALVAVCALGAVLHAASLVSPGAARVLPFPVGAAFAGVGDDAQVDRAAAAVRAASRPGDEVLVNPLVALLAGRRLVGGQADWFILHARERRCGAARPACRAWSRVKRAARRAPVVGVDDNVTSFDPGFARDVAATAAPAVFRSRRAPLLTAIHARR